MRNDKKIGILTLHSGYNEGGILQAFCLANHLQGSIMNSSVEIVDHRYPGKVRAYGPARDDKTRVLNDFVDHSLPLSKRRFLSDDPGATFAFIRENYDAVVTGSDELWKLKYTKRWFGLVSEQRDPWCPPFPNVYWSDESISIPKIAYAVSIGKTDWHSIPDRHLARMRKILSCYSLLGIRDRRTMSFLEWLDPKIAGMAEWVPDPTFSTDFSLLVDREALKQKLQRWGVDFSLPRICTVLRDMPEVNSVIQQIKTKGFQIVGLSLPNSVADVALFDKGLTPLEWVGVLGLMDFCISHRMHACIACILNDVPFVAVDIYSNPSDDDTKVKDLMRSFNLLDFYYNAEKDPPDKFRKICDRMLNDPWPTKELSTIRRLFQSRSEEFTEKIQKNLMDAIH